MATRYSEGSVLALPRRHGEDWEDWQCDDDDDVLTLIDVNEPLPLYGAKLAEKEANTTRIKRSTSPATSLNHPLTKTNMDLPTGSGFEAHPIQAKPSQNLAVPSPAPGQSSRRSTRHLSTRTSRHAAGRVSRPASRRRQKQAQSKLRVITDMSTLRRQNHQPPKRLSPEARPPKFVDLAALAALEGEPTPASFGNWGWLRKTILQSPKPSSPKQKAASSEDVLSPEDRPIMIGMTFPPGESAARENRHLLRTGGTNTHLPSGQRTAGNAFAVSSALPFATTLDTSSSDANQLKSVWSPDTPDTVCSFASIRPASSVYSQMTVPGTAAAACLSGSGAPPVPALPANYQQTPQQKLLNQRLGLSRVGADDDDDLGTPCTLFEEDGNLAPRASVRGKPWAPTPSTANSAGHGWWDHHLVTPFLDRTLSVASRIQKGMSPADDKVPQNARGSPAASVKRHRVDPESSWPTTTHGLGIAADNGLLITFASDEIATAPKMTTVEMQQADSGRSTPTLRNPTPRKTPSPANDPSRTQLTQMEDFHEDKSQPLASKQGRVDIPPPYSPPKRQLTEGLFSRGELRTEQAKDSHGQAPTREALGLALTLSSQGSTTRFDTGPEKTPVDRSTRDVALMISMTKRPVPPAISSEGDGQAVGALSSQPGKTAMIIQGPSQSRFSSSPDSITNPVTLGGDLGFVERHMASVRSKPQPCPAQLDVSHPDDRFHRDLEEAPRDHLAHETTAPLEKSKSLSGAIGTGVREIPVPLPVRPAGAHIPHDRPAEGQINKVERQRRRHEKEDVTARRVGGFWRGRGCIPLKGCFGRSGREGRKKRRIWAGVIAAIIAVILLAIVLALTLAKHHAAPQTHSIWVNLTDYPPMPTGVLTFVGPDNTVARSGCTEPSTLWSCSLPKDDQSSASAYKPNQPTVVFQIDWDNSTRKAWNTPNGQAPESIQARDSVDGFQPSPSPPSYEEMWFLGETTDNITSSQKAGEPAPFFISILNAVNETVTPPVLSRRDAVARGLKDNATSLGLPPPDLEADGTPKPAVMLPRPVQQPVRLYDRGLPTEHYGFYTYFKRTIYLKSVTVLNRTENNVGLDEDGGCRKTEANYLVTWAQTRMHVQIWTQQLAQNASSLLQKPAGSSAQAPQLMRPGTMPYPVTVTLDTHGGDPSQKFVWDWPVDERQQLDLSKPDLLANNMAIGGSWINHRGRGDAKYGGFDGGSGGCQCQWVNFV